jgi:hypothetical protein
MDKKKGKNERPIGSMTISLNDIEMNKEYPLLNSNNLPVGNLIFG